MKLLLRAIAIVALSTFCIQTIRPLKPSQQAVRASKQDSRKITVTITGNDGTEISKTTFNRNTDRVGGKLRGKSGSLWFDWDKAPNTITAYYNDEPDKAFGKLVSSEEPERSEIVISGTTIDIVRPTGQERVMATEPETLPVTLKIAAEGLWDIVIGNNHLTSRIAQKFLQGQKQFNDPKYPEVLSGSSSASKKGCDDVQCVVKIYQPKIAKDLKDVAGATRIYAQKIGGKGVLTTLKDVDVVKLVASNPIIVIDGNGKSKIMSEIDWVKKSASLEKVTKVEQVKAIAKQEQVEEEELLSVAVMLDFYERIQDEATKQTLLKLTELALDKALGGGAANELRRTIESHIKSDMDSMAKAFLGKLNAVSYSHLLKKYSSVLQEMVREMKAPQ